MIDALRFLLVVVGLVALAWDVLVVLRGQVGQGKTFSWQTYALSKKYPAIPFIAGLVVAWAFPGYELPVIVAAVCGHIFATMRGAK